MVSLTCGGTTLNGTQTGEDDLRSKSSLRSNLGLQSAVFGTEVSETSVGVLDLTGVGDFVSVGDLGDGLEVNDLFGLGVNDLFGLGVNDLFGLGVNDLFGLGVLEHCSLSLDRGDGMLTGLLWRCIHGRKRILSSSSLLESTEESLEVLRTIYNK